MKRNTYDRHTLYQEVWECPMSTVSRRYGISDVMLKKICKKLNVPTSQRGYWAKRAAGKPTSVPRLPYPEHHESIVGWGMDESEIRAAAEERRDPLEDLDAREREWLYHVARGIEYNPRIRLRPMLKQMRDTGGCPGPIRRVNQPQSYSYDAWVSGEQTARTMAMIEALARAVESVGGALVDPLKLNVLGEAVGLVIKERAVKQEHVLTQQEENEIERYERDKKRGRWAYKPNIRKWDFRFTGKLAIWVVGDDEFVDTDKLRLEERLPEVFVSICRSAMRWRAERQETDARKREFEEEVARAQKAVNDYNAETKKLTVALTQAKNWERANLLRNYASALSQSNQEDWEEYAQWIMGKADWLDPLVGKEDDVFGVFAGGSVPPEPKRDVRVYIPFEIESFYRKHGANPDASWDRFCELKPATAQRSD